MLKVQSLRFSYPNSGPVIKGVSAQLKSGEIASIVGKTGAGKSTLLKCIAGFHDLDSGTINIDGEKVSGPDQNLIPGHPEIKHVAQDFNLLPNHTVAENIGAELHQYFKYQKKDLTRRILQQFSLWKLRKEFPRNLSGGQQQRVALAKALAERPKLLLLDEPFNQQDSWNKGEVLEAIRVLAKEMAIAIILVTHQYEDALYLSDQIWVMKRGKIVQKGTPDEVFFKPKSEAVARLFGDYLILEEQIVRPSQLKVTMKPTNLKGQVVSCRFRGHLSEYVIDLQDQRFHLLSTLNLSIGSIYFRLPDYF